MTESVTMYSRNSSVDAHVGLRIRLRRLQLGLSQEKLGEALGVTFQQIQKYERGANRVGASRLYNMANVLDVPISFFFDDMQPGKQAQPITPSAAAFAEKRKAFGAAQPCGDEQSLLARKETLDLVRAYYRIQQPALRQKVLELIQSMTDETQSKPF
ncbi:helix-turn-helix domain-containing protein [Acetobacter vaccinii]|uniref:Helix-turn-helix transcriptional regulator n=1 Tax=Acetobacter vaccinii TaxID=2592655 RepID=A0A5C1YMQ4_9PROT|nr:helix-turn-helix transcriptional regulator [Acetobacter vaccinii]QEO16745.1 helix-turn-helix transcriptional regulator [Acetobacter vaccinii]